MIMIFDIYKILHIFRLPLNNELFYIKTHIIKFNLKYIFSTLLTKIICFFKLVLDILKSPNFP